MAAWTKEELQKIETAEELQIAGLRMDNTLRKAVIIWVVRLGEGLYVRSAHGSGSGWFRGSQVRHEGHISAGGIEKDVVFEEVADSEINEKVDAAYLSKYARYPQFVAPMVTPEVRATTLKLVPK